MIMPARSEPLPLPDRISRAFFDRQVRTVLKIIAGEVPPCFVNDPALIKRNAFYLATVEIGDDILTGRCEACGLIFNRRDVAVHIYHVDCPNCASAVPREAFI